MSGSANDGSGGNRMNDGNVRGGAAGGWSIGRWVLLLSLALNVALGAALLLPLVAADHYRGQRSGHSHGGDHMPSPRQLRRLLGEEREAVVDAVFEKHRPALRETFRPLHAARGAVHAAMHAEPFDRAALDAAFAELRERDAATAAAVQAMLSGSMHMATGSGAAAFTTATIEGAPPFVLVGSWVNVFPYKVMAVKEIAKIEDLKGKTGHVGALSSSCERLKLRVRFGINSSGNWPTSR